MLDLNLIDGLEIRVGRSLSILLKNTRFFTTYFEDDFNRDSDEPQMAGIHFINNSPRIIVHYKIGPILWHD